MEQTDYYDILGVDKNASSKEIKEAFRDLALKHHPDRNKDNPDNADKMKELNEAYAVLSNDDKREEYDQLRNQYGGAAYGHFREQFSEQDIFRGADIASIFEEVSRSFSLKGFDDVMSDYDSNKYDTYTIKSPGFKGRGLFSFTAAFGTSPKKGQGKMGKRSLSQSIKNVSKRLIGGVRNTDSYQKGNDLYDVIEIDPDLSKTGGAVAYYHKQKSKKLIVHIPKNIKEGQKIRLSKMGDGEHTVGPAGDLIIKVTFRKPFFEKIRGLVRIFSK